MILDWIGAQADAGYNSKQGCECAVKTILPSESASNASRCLAGIAKRPFASIFKLAAPLNTFLFTANFIC